ncbi:MAG: hypothetical protein ACPGVU_24770 [Limisphaerales bacterium]
MTLAGTVVAIALFLSALSSGAWSGPLARPTYYAPPGCPPGVMQQVGQAVDRKDCNFLGGIFFSLGASWSVGGNTFALNEFLKGLSECPGMRLEIRKPKDYNYKGDWHVYTFLSEDQFYFRVTINTNTSRIVPDAIQIPKLIGPPLKLAK